MYASMTMSLWIKAFAKLHIQKILYKCFIAGYFLFTMYFHLTATLTKELQLVSEWVARNQLVLNISKTKGIVFGTNNSLNPVSQRLVMNNVEIEQVEVLGVTLVCKMVKTY